MEERETQLEQLQRHFRIKRHLHFFPRESQEIDFPPLWQQYADDNGHWLTSWDDDSIEMELLVNFGQPSVDAYRGLDSEQRKRAAMALVLSIEPGIAFTDGCDLLDDEQEPQVAGDDVYHIFDGETLLVCGYATPQQEGGTQSSSLSLSQEEEVQSQRFKQLAMRLLSLQPEETQSSSPLQLQLCEVPWLVAIDCE